MLTRLLFLASGVGVIVALFFPWHAGISSIEGAVYALMLTMYCLVLNGILIERKQYALECFILRVLEDSGTGRGARLRVLIEEIGRLRAKRRDTAMTLREAFLFQPSVFLMLRALEWLEHFGLVTSHDAKLTPWELADRGGKPACEWRITPEGSEWLRWRQAHTWPM